MNKAKMYSPKQKAIKAVLKKTKRQVSDSPQAQLMFSVFEQAFKDAFSSKGGSRTKAHKESGLEYVYGDMPHLQAIGIEPQWVRRLIKESGLEEIEADCRAETARCEARKDFYKQFEENFPGWLEEGEAEASP